MNNYYVYIFLNPLKPGKYEYKNFVTFLFEPFYIGKGKCYRIKEHLLKSREKRSNNFKMNVINKIRKNNLEPISFKLVDNITEQCSFCFEKFLIQLIGRRDINLGPLTNLTDGGEGNSGYKWTEEQKENYRKVHPDFSGENNPMFGKRLSEEECEKFRGENNGFFNHTHTEEVRNFIREFRTGTKLSEETKSKISEHSKNSIWICNKDLNISKFIPIERSELYTKQGWTRGRVYKNMELFKEKSKINNSNRMWLYNKQLKKEIYIKKEFLDDYFKNGWLKGRIKGKML